MTRVRAWSLVIFTVIVASCDGDASSPAPEPSASDVPATVGSAPPDVVLAASTTPESVDAADSATAPSTTVAASTTIPVGPVGTRPLDIETDEGRIQIGEAELPESAAGFPLPDGIELDLASDTGTDAGFSGVAPGSIVELADFYRASLPAAGYQIVDERSPGGDTDDPSVVLMSFESDGQIGDVALARAPGGAGTSVIVTIASR